MNRKQMLVIVGLALVVVIAVTGCSGVPTPAPTPPPATSAPQATATPIKRIKVAMLAAVTGNYAASGRPVVTPVNLALADYNKNAKTPIDLVFEDCGSDNSTAINALNRALESKPAGLLSFCISPQVNAIAPTLAKENLPTVLFATVPTFYEQGWKWIFGTLPTTDVEASAGLTYLKQDLGKSKVALFVPNDDSGKAVTTALEPVAKLLGIELVPAPFASNDNDYSGNIAAARSNQPDAYMLIGAASDTAKLLRQIKQAGIQETIIGHEWTGSAFLNLMDPSEVEGVYTWAEAMPETSKDPKVLAFAKALKEKNNQSIDWIATSAYDSAMILFNAVGSTGGDRKVIDYLHALHDYQGLSGEYNFDVTGRGRHETNLVKIGANKQIILLKTVKVNPQ